MDSDEEVATRRYQQTLDFGPADDSEITKVEVAPFDSSHSDIIWGYSSSTQTSPAAPQSSATQNRPAQPIRRRTNRPMGRAPRRPCNNRTRGSRRVRAGPSSSDDDPHEDGESDGSCSRPLSLGVG